MSKIIYAEGIRVQSSTSLYHKYQKLTNIDLCILACAKLDTVGFMCSRERGHEGIHVAADIDNEIVAVWRDHDED